MSVPGVGPHTLRTSGLCPGPIDTPMISALLNDPGFSGSMTDMIPQGRVGRPQEVAEVAVFLAADAVSYLNGMILPVDGGWTVK